MLLKLRRNYLKATEGERERDECQGSTARQIEIRLRIHFLRGDIQWAQSINIDELSMRFRSMHTMVAPEHIISNFIACKSKILRTFITI